MTRTDQTPARAALSFSGVSKVYRLYPSPKDRFLEALTGRRRHDEVRALDEVTGSVPAGSVVGLIGENGSGKSTLLKILAGTTDPTSGAVVRQGRIASILELGSSFHPEVTGRRNAVLQAALTGLSRAEVDEAIPLIEAFAELGDFFDRPVKTYSSGMQMRLAFAVATAVLPDVVILDEALAVGDAHFQKKCVDRIFELKASGRTILFCSHAMYYVTTLCDSALWLRSGRLAAEGSSQKVVLEYEKFLARKEQTIADESAAASTTAPASAQARRAPARFRAVRLLDGAGRESMTFRPGDPWTVELDFEADSPARPLQVHVGVKTPDQVACFAFDSRREGIGPFLGLPRYVVRLSLDALPLAKGEFVVNVFVGDDEALVEYDKRSISGFTVDTDEWAVGLIAVHGRWSGDLPAGGAS